LTRRRFIADEFSFHHAALIGDHADHLIRVLRARLGQEFDIASGQTVRLGRIVSIGEHRVEFELGEEVASPEALKITLVLAIFKFDRMEWAIEKCTELGVSGFVPVIARRSDQHLAGAASKRVERWRRIVREASEQSRRASVPDIAAPIKFADAVAKSEGTRIVLSESETELSLKQALQQNHGTTVILAIGPEGGWAEDELKSFQHAGWTSASLGSTILRAETAALAATAIVRSELGQ